MSLFQQCDNQDRFYRPSSGLSAEQPCPRPTGLNAPRAASRGNLWVLLAIWLLYAGLALSIDESRMIQAARSLGGPALSGLLAWQKMHNATAAAGESVKLSTVNSFFNQRIRFSDDVSVWGQTDYWATPMETLFKGAGDCEDFAIAKYFTLLALGVPPARLRLTYVRAAMNREGATVFLPHMVLAYYAQPGGEPLVLDNLVDTIQPASARPDLRPVFSFNTEGLWEQMGSTLSTVSLDRLSRWRDLLQRVSQEGFR